MDLSKYAPLFIAALVVLVAIAAHYFIPGTPIEKAVDDAAEIIVKDETGFTLPMDNSTQIIQKSA